MKTLMIAAVTAATLSAASVAQANDLAFVGGFEYSTRGAGVFETTAGVEYTIENFTFAPLVTLNNSTGNFDLNKVELEVGYDVNENVNLYVNFVTNRALTLTETQVGVEFRF